VGTALRALAHPTLAEMIEAGERTIFAFGVRPDLSTADWASALAEQVYRAMVQADSTTQNQ